jgi:pyruvate/2-oxoglutarate dehydrogenase complex dihydrolipoamide acyltransferase (E2) component
LQLIDDVEVASLDTGVVTKLHVHTGDYVAEGALCCWNSIASYHEGEAAVKKMACLVADAEAGQ